ncbi:MAG: hypothetical protein K0Q49_1268 [Haloplasmataceae bacterium]|jgi:hypothetical protein|nr:hypothetical protein [Haloplasmataceae bacterium]
MSRTRHSALCDLVGYLQNSTPICITYLKSSKIIIRFDVVMLNQNRKEYSKINNLFQKLNGQL